MTNPNESPIDVFKRKIAHMTLQELTTVQMNLSAEHVPDNDEMGILFDKCHDLLNEQVSNRITKLFEQS